jgi:(2Fe-2S) ferredoxin/methylase of polypeptide subunit release factors
MEPFRFHIYMCTQKKPEGAPSCLGIGANETLAALNHELKKAGVSDDVQVTTCGCLGICGKGPNMVIYPDGTWYTGLNPQRVSTIVKDHIKGNQPVKEFMVNDAATLKKDIIAHDQMVQTMKDLMEKAGVVPEELNQFMRGFMESRLFLTAVELDLFTAIGNGAKAADIAKAIQTDPRATEALLNALTAIQVLEKENNAFKNTPLTTKYLVKGSEHDSRIATMHVVGLWHRWSTLTECLKKGASVAVERGEERDEDETRAFIAAMHKNAVFRSEKTAQILDLNGVNKILDLGGGSGAYSIAFTKHKPNITATVFDLPAVIPLTQKYVSDEGLQDRIEFIEGNMVTDTYGDGYDLVWISAICHMFGPDENLKIFEKVYHALNPNGRIIVQDFILDDTKTSPRFGAIFALNMLVNTKAGSSYSKQEYFDWVSLAGFKDANLMELPGPTDLIIAKKV